MLGSLVLSSTIVLKLEPSEKRSEDIHSMVKKGAKRLERWAYTREVVFSKYKYDIPPPDQINSYKLSSGGAVTS